MILKQFKKGRDYLLVKCDECGLEWENMKRYYDTKSKNPLWDKDRCNSCWRKVLNNRPEYKANMSKRLKQKHQDDPMIKERISKTMKERQVNVGDKNGMKKFDVRQRVSKSRKEKFKNDPEFMERHREMMKQRWKDGIFDNVNVGRCKWFDYIDRNNNEWKVQGTWELAFVKWLDENEFTFKVHRDRIPYQMEDGWHSYYPDFWVEEWQCYVDIKAQYFLDLQKDKFEAIKSTTNIKLRILLKEDLKQLGIIL